MRVRDYCRQLIGKPRHAVSRLRQLLAPRAHERPPEHIAGLARDISSALRQGRTPPMAGLGVYQHLALLRSLIQTEGLAVCKAYAACTDLPLGRFRPFDLLVTLVRAAPRSAAGDAGDLGPSPAGGGVLALPARGRAKALVVFTDVLQHFGCPLPIVHQWFRGLDASLIYVFDTAGTYYLGGIPPLAGTPAEAAGALREIAGGMGATSLRCAGNSGGGFGALAYAPLLGAQRCLALSPPTTIRESLEDVCLKAPQARSLVNEEGTISLRSLYRHTPVRPLSRVIHAAGNIHDGEEARGLAGLAGIAVTTLPGITDHNLVPLLIERNQFAGELDWLMAG
jgi:hypothetical protein